MEGLKEKKQANRRKADEHKASLTKGCKRGRAVREYLAALNEEKRPGRKVEPETLAQKIAQVDGLVVTLSARPVLLRADG